MKILILAHADDNTALRVYKALRTQHGPDQVSLVSGEELALAPHWEHRLEDTGVTSRVRLNSGEVIDGALLGAVFNRLRYTPLPHFEGSTEDDKHYAVMETFALWLSWLASLHCPVINRATPRGLGAQTRSHAEWLYLAGQAGLPVQEYRFTTNARRFPVERDWGLRQEPVINTMSDPIIPAIGRQPALYLEPMGETRASILIAGPVSRGHLAEQFRVPLQRLATLAECDLLEVTLAQSARTWPDWKVCDVSSFPDVREPEVIRLIADLVTSKADVCEECQ